jgi:hypothetical protein
MYKNRKMNRNVRGYFYLYIPRPLVEATGLKESRLVDIELKKEGILIRPV